VTSPPLLFSARDLPVPGSECYEERFAARMPRRRGGHHMAKKTVKKAAKKPVAKKAAKKR
jgi:hypothetical protein